MIGKTVEVVVDRPIGSYHPKFKDSVYKVNYGFIPHTLGRDEKELGCYILGVDKPIEKFEGVVIAIIERLDDIENKLVVSKEGMKFSALEIKKYVYPQEKYFKTRIITNEGDL